MMRKKLSMVKRLQGEGNKVIRRTITVDDEVNNALNKIRASLLSERNIELDFTSAINGFARLGIERLLTGELTDSENVVISKYLFNYNELKEEVAADEWINKFIQTRLPKLINELLRPGGK